MFLIFSYNFRSFNPRICKRCDFFFDISVRFCLVSIHASVKDATVEEANKIFPGTVSIHASVKDATIKQDIVSKKRQVSIHASVKDATLGRT